MTGGQALLVATVGAAGVGAGRGRRVLPGAARPAGAGSSPPRSRQPAAARRRSAGTPAAVRRPVARSSTCPGCPPDLRFHLGVDGISYPLVVLTALLTLLCCAVHLWTVPRRGPRPAAGRAAAGDRGRHRRRVPRPRPGAVLRVLRGRAAADVRGDRGLGRRASAGAAARKFVLYTLFGSVLLLVGVFCVVAAGRHRRPGRADRPARGAVAAAPSWPRSCCSRSRSR